MPDQKLRETEISFARLAVDGDERAFSELAESLRGRLGRYSMMVCHQREDAEEVVQETFMHAFQNIAQLREPEGIHAWIFRIALNNCRMKRRRRVHDPLEIEQLEAYGTHGSITDGRPTPEDTLLSAESKEWLEESILALPETYRIVVILRCLEGLSTEETAQVIETSPEVVRTRLHRARVIIARQCALNAYS